jgi:TonB-dependent receptor-like protein
VFGQVKRVPDFYTGSWTATLSATILNEFRLGIKRDTWQGTSPFDRDCCWSGAKETDIDDLSKEMVASYPNFNGRLMYVGQSLGLGNYAPFGVASPRQSISPFKQFADTLSFTKGAHSYQAGFSMDFTGSHGFNHGGQQTTRPNATLGVGAVPVQNITTANFRGLNASDITTAQNVLANLAGSISGIVQQYFVNSPTATDWADYRQTMLFERYQHQNDWNLFFKDNWKASKNLTLNLGLRYDKYGVVYDSTGLGGRFTGGATGKGGQAALFGCSGGDFSVMWNPNAGCDPAKLTTTEFVGKGSPNPDKQFWNDEWTNFSPSFGFSYNVPWFKRSTVIRGGYGINFAGAPGFLGYNGNIGNLPGQTYNASFTPATYLDLSSLVASSGAGVIPVTTLGTKPFGAVPMTARTTGITGYADDRSVPYVQSFNLSVQRELARNLTIDLSWVGNKATKLYTGTQLNELNIYENGILDAFNVTRAGGNAPLFDRLLRGLNVTGVGVVNGTSLTGSQALRALSTTNSFLANGDVGGLANFINGTSSFTGSNGGLLRNAGLPENFIVVNPQFGSVTLSGDNSNSTYHSFQAVATRRLTSGLYIQGSYVFSKSLGDTGVRDPRNRVLSHAILDIDRADVVKFNGTYDLPFGPGKHFLGNAPSVVSRIVEGWQLSSAYQWLSGAPISFTSALGTAGFRATNTADLVGNLPGNLGKVERRNGFVEYFSQLSAKTAALPNFGGDTNLAGRFTNQVVVDKSGNIILQNPVPGVTGNTAANLSTVRGPTQLNFDMALTKKVRITEGKTFTLRADAVNILNRPVWGNPNTNINSVSFGRITTAAGNRTITFNARVDF